MNDCKLGICSECGSLDSVKTCPKCGALVCYKCRLNLKHVGEKPKTVSLLIYDDSLDVKVVRASYDHQKIMDMENEANGNDQFGPYYSQIIEINKEKE